MKTLYCPNNFRKNASHQKRFFSKQLFPVFLVFSLFSRGLFAAEEERPVFKVTERDHLTALSRISQLECQRAALEKYLKLLEEQNKAYLDQKIRMASSLKKVGKTFAHLSSSLLELDRLRERGIEQDLPSQKREPSVALKNEDQGFIKPLKDSHGDLSPSFARSSLSSSDEKASLIIQNLLREVSEKDRTIRELINDLERHGRTSPAHVPPVLPVFSPVFQKEARTQTPFTISQHHEEIQTDTLPVSNSGTSPLEDLPVQLHLLQRASLVPQEDIVLKEVGNQTDFEEEIVPPHQRHGSVQTEEEHPQYQDVILQAAVSTQDAQTQQEELFVREGGIQTDSDEEMIPLPQVSVAVQTDHEAEHHQPRDSEVQTETRTQDAQTQKNLNVQSLLNKRAALKEDYVLFKETTSREFENFKKEWEASHVLLLSRLDALEQEGKSLRTRNAFLENQQKQADFLRIEKEALEDLTVQQREQIECLSSRRQGDRFDKAEGYGQAQQFASYAQGKVDKVLESMMDLVSKTKDLSSQDITAFFDEILRQRKSMATHSRYFLGMEDVLLGLRESLLSLKGHSPSVFISPSPSNPFRVAFDFKEEGEEQPNHEQRPMVYDPLPTSLDEDPHELSRIMREKTIVDRQRMKEQKKWQKEERRRSKKLEKENQRKSAEERNKAPWQKYQDSLAEAEEFLDTLDQDRGVTSHHVNFDPGKSRDSEDGHETFSRLPLNDMVFNRKTNQFLPKPPFLSIEEENDENPFLLISGSPLVPLKTHKASQQREHQEKRPVISRKHQGRPLEDKENIPMNRIPSSIKMSSYTSVNKSAPDKSSVIGGHKNDWLDVSCLVDMKRSSGRLSKPSLQLKQVDDVNMRSFR